MAVAYLEPSAKTWTGERLNKKDKSPQLHYSATNANTASMQHCTDRARSQYATITQKIQPPIPSIMTLVACGCFQRLL